MVDAAKKVSPMLDQASLDKAITDFNAFMTGEKFLQADLDKVMALVGKGANKSFDERFFDLAEDIGRYDTRYHEHALLILNRARRIQNGSDVTPWQSVLGLNNEEDNFAEDLKKIRLYAKETYKAAVAKLKPGSAYTTEAKELLAQANAGDVEAMVEVSVRLDYGRNGFTQSSEAGYKFDIMGANGGNAPSQWRAAARYEKGVGVSQDLARAVAWYVVATENGSEDAKKSLATLVESADATKVPDDKLVELEYTGKDAKKRITTDQIKHGYAQALKYMGTKGITPSAELAAKAGELGAPALLSDAEKKPLLAMQANASAIAAATKEILGEDGSDVTLSSKTGDELKALRTATAELVNKHRAVLSGTQEERNAVYKELVDAYEASDTPDAWAAGYALDILQRSVEHADATEKGTTLTKFTRETYIEASKDYIAYAKDPKAWRDAYAKTIAAADAGAEASKADEPGAEEDELPTADAVAGQAEIDAAAEAGVKGGTPTDPKLKADAKADADKPKPDAKADAKVDDKAKADAGKPKVDAKPDAKPEAAKEDKKTEASASEAAATLNIPKGGSLSLSILENKALMEQAAAAFPALSKPLQAYQMAILIAKANGIATPDLVPPGDVKVPALKDIQKSLVEDFQCEYDPADATKIKACGEVTYTKNASLVDLLAGLTKAGKKAEAAAANTPPAISDDLKKALAEAASALGEKDKSGMLLDNKIDDTELKLVKKGLEALQKQLPKTTGDVSEELRLLVNGVLGKIAEGGVQETNATVGQTIADIRKVVPATPGK